MVKPNPTITKYLFELEKENLRIKRLEIVLSFPKLIVICGTIVLLVYVTLRGLKPFIGEEGDLILKIIESLKLGTIISVFVNAILSLLWWTERSGKKRAIREKSRYQKILEESDQYRSSSNLTETGATPRRKKK